MQTHSTLFKSIAFGVAVSCSYASQALAAPDELVLNSYTTYNGASTVTVTDPTANNLAVPAAYHYGHSYSSPTLTIPGSTNPPGYGFYDDYVFTIGGATANSISTTINLANFLAITDLQQRIYSLAGNSVPTLGLPSGTVYQSWTTPISTSVPGVTGTTTIISDLVLNPGTYVLEVRGNVTGAFGGSYSGVLNLTAVPIPAALPLLLSGLGLLAVRARRKA